MMRISPASIVSLLLLAGTAAFVSTAVALYDGLEQVLARNATLEHARQAQLLIRRTATLLLDLETGQRGFIITGQPAMLAPYDRARLIFDANYAELRQHLYGADPRPADLQRLDELSHERIHQVERNVERRWAIGDAVLKDLKFFESGQQLTEEIRTELARLEAVQDERIRRANSGIRDVQRRTMLLAAALPAVGCVLILGAIVALRHQRRKRDEAEMALHVAKLELEQAVDDRTRRLREALTRIQNFAAELDASIEAERKQLARDVHDQIGQIGTAVKMLSLSLRGKVGTEHQASVQELIALADEAIDTARTISAALRPPLLDDLGLAAALRHYAQGLSRRGDLPVEVDVRDDETLTPAQANQLFRIVQEASTNALRHAEAGLLEIQGALIDAGEEAEAGYRLEIIDDGIGISKSRLGSSGLLNMRERATLANGRLEIGAGRNGVGTRVSIVFPRVAA
jgi:signal transduction histidine kinase